MLRSAAIAPSFVTVRVGASQLAGRRVRGDCTTLDAKDPVGSNIDAMVSQIYTQWRSAVNFG